MTTPVIYATYHVLYVFVWSIDTSIFTLANQKEVEEIKSRPGEQVIEKGSSCASNVEVPSWRRSKADSNFTFNLLLGICNWCRDGKTPAHVTLPVKTTLTENWWSDVWNNPNRHPWSSNHGRHFSCLPLLDRRRAFPPSVYKDITQG